MDKNSDAASTSDSENTPMLIDANVSDRAVIEVRVSEFSLSLSNRLIIRMLKYGSVFQRVHSNVHRKFVFVHRNFDELLASFNNNKHN